MAWDAKLHGWVSPRTFAQKAMELAAAEGRDLDTPQRQELQKTAESLNEGNLIRLMHKMEERRQWVEGAVEAWKKYKQMPEQPVPDEALATARQGHPPLTRLVTRANDAAVKGARRLHIPLPDVLAPQLLRRLDEPSFRKLLRFQSPENLQFLGRMDTLPPAELQSGFEKHLIHDALYGAPLRSIDSAILGPELYSSDIIPLSFREAGAYSLTTLLGGSIQR